MRQLPEVRSCQVSTANPGTLKRLLHSFEHALQLLVTQVRARGARILLLLVGFDKYVHIMAKSKFGLEEVLNWQRKSQSILNVKGKGDTGASR